MVTAALELRAREHRQMFGLEVRNDALKLSLGIEDEFEHLQVTGNVVMRTVLFCAENIDSTHFISNCKVHAGYNGYNIPLLQDAFTLNPSEKKFIALAYCTDNPGNTSIWMCGLRGGGLFAEAYEHLRLKDDITVVTIEASCKETRAAKLVCRVFANESGKLIVEKV